MTTDKATSQDSPNNSALGRFIAVIPAGGVGTRLWPLSRAAAPKFLHDLTGSGSTLLRSTYDRLEPLAGKHMLVDGMGGHRAGERASAIAVAAIEYFTLNSFKWFFGANDVEAQRVLAQFQSAVTGADARILEEAAEHPELSGMGTTMTMAFHLGTRLCVLHVGDSDVDDVKGAKDAGLRVAWVNRDGRARRRDVPAPDFEIRDLSEVPRLLGRR